MPHRTIQLQTADGPCTTQIFCPDGGEPWPAVIMYMDAVGVRPALMEIAERIAGAGYYTMLPDLFHRVDFDASQGLRLFTDPEYRRDLMSRVVPTAGPANAMRDTDALFAHIDARPDVRADRVGVTGYCMGGRVAMYAAGHFGHRISGAASYHASGLATDAPESPHLLAPNIRARVYVAGAIEDAGFDDVQKARLEQALTDAKVDHTVETYQARHGFVPRDTPVHDEAATARHWTTLLSLFHDTLGGASS